MHGASAFSCVTVQFLPPVFIILQIDTIEKTAHKNTFLSSLIYVQHAFCYETANCLSRAIAELKWKIGAMDSSA